MLVRHDLNLEQVGKMAELLDDLSPLQIGTQGKYKGQPFELVGRIRVSWSAGAWSEWCALFSDGTAGWLSEAQGFYAMSFVVEAVSGLPDRSDIKRGMSLSFAGKAFHVDDVKEATCIGSQGELPFRAPQGRKTLSVDLSTLEGEGFATIEYSSEGVACYVGEYLQFDELMLKQFRQLDGW
jgi:hypothetical protein